MSARLAVALLGLLASSSCGGAAPVATAGPVGGTITVFAASSLTESFGALGAEFSRANPGSVARFSFAGSSTLVAQLAQGAEADVFASADQPNMTRFIEAGLADGEPRIFAGNRLQIVVPPGNPARVAGLGDLARAGLIVVLAAPSVPVGTYAAQALARAGVTVRPASLEADVKAVVGKVAFGEADAGVAYATDVRAGRPRVQGVDVPEQQNVVVRYPIAAVKGAKNRTTAVAFVNFVLSDRGRDVLAGFGFLAP